MNEITMTIGSTGFVNYFPSEERTDRNVEAAYKKNGKNIVIIDGHDNCYASIIFHPSILCRHYFNIPIVDSFHSGVSGIMTSGVVISKNDFDKFVKMFNRKKYVILKDHPNKVGGCHRIRIYNRETGSLNKFFEMFFNLKSKHANVKVVNFKEAKKPCIISIK